MNPRIKKAVNYSDNLIQVLTDSIIELREQNETIIYKLTNLENIKLDDEEHADMPEILRVNHVCLITTLTSQTIYDRVAKGTIPHSRTGKNIIFNKKEIIRWKNSKGLCHAIS
jgi:predicted DNA-binding transcriptional regulator AlpA